MPPKNEWHFHSRDVVPLTAVSSRPSPAIFIRKLQTSLSSTHWRGACCIEFFEMQKLKAINSTNESCNFQSPKQFKAKDQFFTCSRKLISSSFNWLMIPQLLLTEANFEVLFLIIDLYWKYLGGRESVQDVRYVWIGYSQKIWRTDTGNLTAVSIMQLFQAGTIICIFHQPAYRKFREFL